MAGVREVGGGPVIRRQCATEGGGEGVKRRQCCRGAYWNVQGGGAGGEARHGALGAVEGQPLSQREYSRSTHPTITASMHGSEHVYIQVACSQARGVWCCLPSARPRYRQPGGEWARSLTLGLNYGCFFALCPTLLLRETLAPLDAGGRPWAQCQLPRCSCQPVTNHRLSSMLCPGGQPLSRGLKSAAAVWLCTHLDHILVSQYPAAYKSSLRQPPGFEKHQQNMKLALVLLGCALCVMLVPAHSLEARKLMSTSGAGYGGLPPEQNAPA